MQQNSLFGALQLPQRNQSKERNNELVQKASKPKPGKVVVKQNALIEKKGTIAPALIAKIEAAVAIARQNLVQDSSLECVRDEKRLLEYVDNMIQNGLGGVDTETTGLDPIDNKIVGLGLYTPGEKAIYVPMHHTDYYKADLPNQLPDELVAEALRRIEEARVRQYYHNAKFDIRIIRNSLGIKLTPYWDSSLAGNFLNENEPHRLKPLHNKYVLKNRGTAQTYDELFDDIPFNYVPIDIAYLYAAKDPKITIELGQYQEQFLTVGETKCQGAGLEEAAVLLRETEIPLIPHLADMEDMGVRIVGDYAMKLSHSYTMEQKQLEEKIQSVIRSLPLQNLPPAKRNKIELPVNLNSPTQLAIIIYDVMKLKSPDGSRSTDEENLKELKYSAEGYTQFFEDLLEYRGVTKLLTTYIDKMPRIAKRDGRVHGQFNQYGAKTGRFSSSDPNLQNIPSHRKDIRKMFAATTDYVLLSGDFSQQEPRVLAHLCWVLFNDSGMMDAYVQGRDLYAWMASIIYKVPYDECKEKRPDGSLNPAGKKRRDSVKSIVLGLMYGRGTRAVGEQLGISTEEAQKIVDMLFKTFPAIKRVVDYFKHMASTKGFVQTVYGRKRRLPDIRLPEFVIQNADGTDADPTVAEFYAARLKKARGNKAKYDIKLEAKERGLKVVDNGGKICDAERQTLNSVIQGSSADITKRAMLAIGKDEQLREWGYRMLITVHDEVIGECPKANALKCAERVQMLMINSCVDTITVPMKVDLEITDVWYGEDLTDSLKEAM